MLNSDALFRVALLVLSALGTWLFVYSAWFSDDALISLRQVVMLGDGHGMVWNLGQRVQAFSHTTWFFLLSLGYVLTGSLFHMTLAVSWACVAGALVLYWRYCRALNSGWLMVALMALPLMSAAFRDYMTSGLENPLSFLLAAGIITLVLKKRTARQDQALWLLFALAILTRQDHALHFGPLALWVLYKNGFWRQLRASVPAVALLIGWFAFATFYFGAPLPNTYYAKLTAGVPQADTTELALLYAKVSLDMRMGTVLVIAFGLMAALMASAVSRVLALGIMAHLAYLWSIGGDFMVGRFLTVDFLMCCFIIADGARHIPKPRSTALTAFLALCVFSIERPVVIETDLEKLELRHVIDERLMFASVFGLMSPVRDWPEIRATDPDTKVEHIYAGCGFIGEARFSWPDSIHIIDMCGLTDPYMARLPTFHDQRKKPGHFKRMVDLDYAQLLLTGAFPDGAYGGSRTMLEQIWSISRDPLTAPGRLSSIIGLNVRDTDLDQSHWTHPDKTGQNYLLEENWIGEPPEGFARWIRPSKAHDAYFDRKFGATPNASPSVSALQSRE